MIDNVLKSDARVSRVGQPPITTVIVNNLTMNVAAIIPVLWGKACLKSQENRERRKEFTALLTWWSGKRGYTLKKNVRLSEKDSRRIDFVISSAGQELYMELDTVFKTESFEKLYLAFQTSHQVLYVSATPCASKEVAKNLRAKALLQLKLQSLHWLPLVHAEFGWI